MNKAIAKDFDEILRGRKRQTFKIAGEVFECRAKLSFARLHRVLSTMSGDNDDMVENTIRFMNLVLLPEYKQRFRELLTVDGEDDDAPDDDKVITSEQVEALMAWLMETYTGKRAEPSPSSSPGPEPTPTQPNVVSLNAKSLTG